MFGSSCPGGQEQAQQYLLAGLVQSGLVSAQKKENKSCYEENIKI